MQNELMIYGQMNGYYAKRIDDDDEEEEECTCPFALCAAISSAYRDRARIEGPYRYKRNGTHAKPTPKKAKTVEAQCEPRRRYMGSLANTRPAADISRMRDCPPTADAATGPYATTVYSLTARKMK